MELTAWTRRLIVTGLIAIPIIAICIDIHLGKDLCILVLGGFLGILKPND